MAIELFDKVGGVWDEEGNMLSQPLMDRRKKMDDHVSDFLPELIEALRTQLQEDEERWGNTWLRRLRKGQEERVFEDFKDYWDRYRNAGTPIPWLKVIGNAFIAWIRENNLDLFPE